VDYGNAWKCFKILICSISRGCSLSGIMGICAQWHW